MYVCNANVYGVLVETKCPSPIKIDGKIAKAYYEN